MTRTVSISFWTKILALAALVLVPYLAMTGGTAHAAIGDQLFWSGGDVRITVQPASAGYTSQLRLYNLPTGGSHYIALNNQFGTVVTLSQSFLTSKGYTVGQELIFGIYVTNTGNTFRMGPGSRNGDGISHANVVTLAPSGSYTHRFNVGFEDLYGGGDKDYDDNVFRFEGAVAITPVVPPTADAGGPYTVAEGDSVGLAGTGNDPDNSGVLSFAWDLDNNGSFETAGQNPTFSAAGLDGPSSSIVGLKVTDGDGASGTDTATVNITNVAPNLPSISVTSPVDEGSSATLTGTFTDPGTPDVHTLNIDWGDGSSGPVVLPVGNRTFSIGHQYIDDDPTATPSDDYTVAVSLSDDDGGVATQPSGVFWDFQNATSVGGISTSVGSPITPGVSGVASQTGGGPAENWGGDIVHLTRFIGPSNYPYFDVTVSGPTSLDGLTFSHVHNHNPGFPTAGGYQVQLQIDSGSGYSNIGSPFAVLPGDSGPDTISLNGTVVGTGTHRIRFLASGFAYGNNSNTEFFVLNNVTLNATAPGSYSATVTVNNVAPNLESGVVNLNSWTAENISSGSGSWNVSGDANSVLQTVNGNPTFFYSDFNALGSPLSGSIQVQTTGDDDFIGFAIGFEPGDASNAAADYLLVDWKQGNQSAFGGFAGRGLAVSRVTGIANNTNFWAHNGPVTELARATTLGSTGWGDYQVNQFQFDFSSTQLRVFVNGVLEIDVSPASGTFSDGRFAFYNFSQSQVRYSAIQADGISGLEASSVSLSKNFTDVGTADTHSATINWGDGTGNLPGTVTQGAGSGTVSGNHVYADNGEYTVTVTATDDDGGTDSDTLTATIANVPPTADAGGPYSGPEGSSISLNGSGTDVAGIADPLSYSWDLDNNGSFETPGQNVAFPAVDGPSTHTVSLRVDDGDGGVTIDSTTVTVNNVAPTVTADNASVTINEADTAANTGTFGDVGVDDVTITSSIGDITQAAGTWSWSFDSSDGPDESQTVTITATDSDGAPSSTTFDLTVNNVAPLAIAIGDVIDEDGTATVTGTISDPGTLDSFTVVVNWGGSEGSTTVALPAGSTSFIATHQYLDDNPTGTLSDVYPVSVTVTDDDGGASTANTSVTVNNVAPVLGTGKIVVNNDEWTFSNAGFAANSVSATQFVVNVADYFTGGTPGSFLAYSSNFGLTESSLSTAMANAGHTWTVSTVVPFTVSSLLTYDAVFLAGNYVDQQVLIDYVNAGGNVYIGAGTGWGGAATEAASWNTFLNEFGLNLASVYNGINGSPSPSSSHPLLAGVSTMFFGNGNSVNVTSPSTANAQILFTEQGQGMLGVAAIGSVSANSILENGTATLEASFFDLGTLDQHTVTINWGDGTSADVLTLPVGDRSFTATHQYLDDNPTGTPADNYTISITVSDDDGGSDSESTAIQVTNVAPVITASGGVIDENGIATVTIGVTDPGSLDTFTGVIDWGEGSPEGITASHGVNTYTHQYLDDDPTGTASDIYAVSVTVTD
ncbi:MAG: hypothetical protein HQ478_11060, partial [Chloroflexi bacterium]|nr:hypothetical protein [Chloroflexota bacterium]